MGRPTILVIKLGALGDFVQSLGPMKAIKKHHEHDSVILLTTKPYEKLARLSGYFDDVICDDRPKWFQPLKWRALFKKLNSLKIERVYDLQNNDRTCLYFHLFTKKPEWVGIAKHASHRNASPTRSLGKAFDGHVQTLALAGIDDVKIDDLGWIESQKTFEGLKKPYVLIVAGGSPKHPEKRWPIHHFGAVCQTLAQQGYQPVLIGTKFEETTNSKIEEIEPKCLNLTGKTDLFDLPSLAKNADGAIGNDTGPMHLIGPTGCKTIILFGSKTHPHKHAPLGDKIITIKEANLDNLLPLHVISSFMN